MGVEVSHLATVTAFQMTTFNQMSLEGLFVHTLPPNLSHGDGNCFYTPALPFLQHMDSRTSATPETTTCPCPPHAPSLESAPASPRLGSPISLPRGSGPSTRAAWARAVE